MAGSYGYHQYKGRKPKGKPVLAVFLALVILVAVGFLILQERILFFDETGTPYFRLPETPEEEAPPPEEEEVRLEVTVQPVEEELVTCAFSIPTGTLAAEALEITTAAPCNGVAVTLKDSTGRVYFDSGTAVSGSVSIGEDTAAVLARLTEQNEYAIARISCFHDPRAANREVEAMGLKNTGGYIFYDGNNSQWLDPAKPDAREYLCALAQEAAALGFDEILLTDVSYPTEGKLDKIAYGETAREENLRTFLLEMRSALEPYSVALSIEIPETVVLSGSDSNAGQSLADIAARVDRIYAATAPERVEDLAAAVSAVGDTAEFVPELEGYTGEVAGSWLIF